MTDATTADKLAAWELIGKHGLFLAKTAASKYAVARNASDIPWSLGDTLVAAVRAWAEGAGVEWKPPDVVPMFAAVDAFGPGIREMFLAQKEAEDNCEFWQCGTVVPCEVVIRTESEGV